MRKKILWLVTARSGSKSIPDKNIKLLGGNPLLSYRIKSVLNTNYDFDLWISTDSRKYANLANKYGAEVPFIRPKKLSMDNSSSYDVVLHAMEYAMSLKNEYDYIGMLEPTSPFIKSKQLNDAIYLLDKNVEASGVVSVKESRPHKIFIQKDDKYLDVLAENFNGLKDLTRQAFKKEITPSGGFYISRWESFLKYKTFYTSKTLSFEVDDVSGLEIDEQIDWDFAEFIINNRINIK